jgi:circadian clock protein KaiC
MDRPDGLQIVELVGVRTVRRLRVRKSRGSAALCGFHQYEIADEGISVFPRTDAALRFPSVQDHPDPQPIASGIQGLDTLLGGGLPCGSTTLLMGPSGSGKTSFGINFLAAASERNRRCTSASTKHRRASC